MSHSPKVIAFIGNSPGDLINLVAISSVFSYPKVGGRPAYVSKILTTYSGHELHGRDGLTLANGTPYQKYNGPIDTLVVLGGESAFSEPSSELLQWIIKRSADVRRLVSVCVGAFVLARTGLLDGKRVTTHWHHAARLAQMHPTLQVEKDHIFVKDGNVFTTAGVTAGIDLALAIVEEDLGHEEVASIAHTLVLYHRRPGNEAQYSTLLAQQTDVSGTPLSLLPSWTKARLSEKLGVAELAQSVGMSARTFARHFEAHFKTTPARWIQSLRIDAACEYLGGYNLPLKTIAAHTGFRDEQSLRRAFLQQLAIGPKEYREKFGLGRMPRAP